MDASAEVDLSSLPKKERKKLKHQLERQERLQQEKRGSAVKWLIIAVIVVILGAGGWRVIQELSKPLPGLQFESQGREHVKEEEWSKFPYNSNPPTSGPHDGVWTTTGVYDTEQADGHLIHSLEHGYIVVSYNCGGVGMADGREKKATASTSEANLEIGKPPLSEKECNTLKKQLSDLANKKRIWKLVVVPRPGLDSRIALTAWTYLEKLDKFDDGRINAFIDAHRDHGPEKTME